MQHLAVECVTTTVYSEIVPGICNGIQVSVILCVLKYNESYCRIEVRV